MSASAASVAQASPSRSTPTRDPPRLQVLSALLTFSFAALLLGSGDSLAATISAEWKELLFWGLLVMLLSFFPIAVDDASLTLDEPILLAVALLYPPEVAALVAFFAAIDVREIRRQTVFLRALYNRVQIGFSVYLAGSAFRAVSEGNLDPWPIAIVGTAAAVAAEYLANVALVSLHVRVRWRVDFRNAVRKLKVGDMGQFLATHLGYGILALVLAHMFRGIGAWSVATFLVPILVARQMLIRGQAIETLAEELRNRDRLLRKVSDRIVEERRDERLRVAGDLHDGMLQELTRAWFLSQLTQRKSEECSSASDDLRELGTSLERSIESLRLTIRDLKESSLGRGGLLPTIDSLVRDARLDWRAKINLHVPTTLEVSTETQIVVYQVAREALLNALKHGQSSKIWVRLYKELEKLILEVEDDGIGFRPELTDSAMHFGIGLMQERVRASGGHIEIQSTAQGSSVKAVFPT